MSWEMMAETALQRKIQNESLFCELPFCHTVEGEALGGNICYGKNLSDVRAGVYICETADDVLNLPAIDFSRGRIADVLKSCACLAEKGEPVLLKLSGPVTILNVLMDIRYIFRMMKKQPEKMRDIYQKLGAEITAFMERAQAAGVKIISYADAPVSADIVGSDNVKEITEGFTYPLMAEFEKRLADDRLILLCPKTVGALIDNGLAGWKPVGLDAEVSYGEGCIQAAGKIAFAGQMCMNHMKDILEYRTINGLELYRRC